MFVHWPEIAKGTIALGTRIKADCTLPELTYWVAFCVSFGCLGALWGMVEVLPEAYQTQSHTLITAW